MGLLDDAIREHLELKRRRGANPEEVAREQREALDVVGERGIATADTDDSHPVAAASRAVAGDSPEAEQDGPSGAGDPAADPAPADPPGAGETAELDMSSVLGADDDEQDQTSLSAAGEQSHAGAEPPAAGPMPEEDSLEWEVPGDAAEDEAAEPAEDVLEETPDFLRDTPEQDRLWFEQRPPRDFDFDK
jgi:hypothetical protein